MEEGKTGARTALTRGRCRERPAIPRGGRPAAKRSPQGTTNRERGDRAPRRRKLEQQQQQDRDEPKRHKSRHLTVLNFRRYLCANPVPKLHLAGRWLKNAGFPAGTRVRVSVYKGKLVVESVAPPDPDWQPKEIPPWLFRR